MRVARMFSKYFLFDMNMLYSTAIENTNNIFYCSVKPTYVAFLALTLITTNYWRGTFFSVTWHLQQFFFNLRPHAHHQNLQTLPCLLHIQITITRPWPTSLAVPALRISAFTSRLPSVPMMSRFVPSSQPLSAPSLIVRRWSRNYVSVRFYPSLIQLTSRSATSWRPSPCISQSIRDRLSESPRLLLPQSALIFFLLLTFRELGS